MPAPSSETQFFGMLRALGMMIGYFFAGIFGLFGWLFGSILNVKYESDKQRREEEQARIDAEKMPDLTGDTAQLESNVTRALLEADFPKGQEITALLRETIKEVRTEHNLPTPCESITEILVPLIVDLYDVSGLTALPRRRTFIDPIDEGRYRDELKTVAKRTEDPDRTITVALDALSDLWLGFSQSLPPMALVNASQNNGKPFVTIPLIDVLPDVGRIVENIEYLFCSGDPVELALYQ